MCLEATTMAASSMKMKKSSSFTKSSTQFLLSAPNNKRAKLDLVDYDSLPEFLKHNEFIVSYYRSEWPLKQTILSIFSVHNETLNIWTTVLSTVAPSTGAERRNCVEPLLKEEDFSIFILEYS
ncbi:hypothetical protein MA16_Dca023805 [Dendrobium catenatum]|uniref:Uncharacterized protein n=1 Tax=Dendrobium catenatum TaxID=906689 RepID=A0A2I0XFC9_9ASPA|nr:hypothetical protein MA16_Dca023805 [Dendrobium catenatum]